jgi:hypothetical protein
MAQSKEHVLKKHRQLVPFIIYHKHITGNHNLDYEGYSMSINHLQQRTTRSEPLNNMSVQAQPMPN